MSERKPLLGPSGAPTVIFKSSVPRSRYLVRPANCPNLSTELAFCMPVAQSDVYWWSQRISAPALGLSVVVL
jgi:hypothetical protein